MGFPSVLDKEDPANKLFAVGAVIGVVLLTIATVFIQLHLRSLNSVTVATAPAHLMDGEQLLPPGIDSLTLVGKNVVRGHTYSVLNKDNDDIDLREGIEHIDHLAVTRVDRVRAAILMGELKGKIEAINRLEKLQGEVVDASLKADIEWLLRIYRLGPSELDTSARDSLVARHGWFGQVALMYDKTKLDPNRIEVLAGANEGAMTAIGITILFRGLSFLIGIALAIMAILKIRSGEIVSNFDADTVGGPVYYEIPIAFFLIFGLAMLLRIPAYTAGGTAGTVWFFITEVVVWGCFAAVVWPTFRGVPRDALMLDLGLHTGEGWWPEIKAGFIGYMAAMPLSFVGGIVGAMLAAVFKTDSEETLKGFPMFEAPINASWAVFIMSAFGSVVWAPLLEEIVMRGALYRAVRPWARWLGASLITALVFGIIHPYGIEGLCQVAFGGFAYAIIREWRGSLIACMVAHMLHNGTIELMQFANILAISN